MNKKINIIQFMPYFPPHKGGLETVGEEIGKYWVKNKLGNFINVIFDVGQKDYIKKLNLKESIYYKNKFIGYKKDGYTVFLLPSFDLIINFPFPKFWDRRFWVILKLIKTSPQPSPLEEREQEGESIVITHTRFFLSSLLGGIFARRNKVKWVHIEHGSDYVKLGNKFVSKISYFYDRIIGMWIFKKCDKLLVVSDSCKSFILKEFLDRDIDVFYRGVKIEKSKRLLKKGDIKIVFIGRIVALKGVDLLIKSYKELGIKNELVIIGDGEEKLKLQDLSDNFNIKFLGFKDKEFIFDYLGKNNCILVNPSYQEGMPTTVIEGLITQNVVVASDVGGTKEISKFEDLILFESGNIQNLKEKISFAIPNYKKLVGKSQKYVENKFNRENNIFKLYKLIK